MGCFSPQKTQRNAEKPKPTGGATMTEELILNTIISWREAAAKTSRRVSPGAGPEARVVTVLCDRAERCYSK